jgi:hypothetical protein
MFEATPGWNGPAWSITGRGEECAALPAGSAPCEPTSTACAPPHLHSPYEMQTCARGTAFGRKKRVAEAATSAESDGDQIGEMRLKCGMRRSRER